jgi:uncharacterized protein YukE
VGDSNNGVGLDQYIAGQCTRGTVETPFATGKDMDQMKDMLRNAQPETVLQVANGWKRVSEMLVGGGGIKSTFDQTVSHIMQHWEGDSADAFHAKAQKISKSLEDTATYATYTSVAMKSAGDVLKQIKPEVMAMEKPSGLSSAWDYATDLGDRDDNAYKKDLTGNAGAQNALDKDEGTLSAGKEAQLKMAAKMETLAVAYSSQTATMGSWRQGRVEHGDKDYPGDPGGVAPVPVMVSPDVGTPHGSTSGGSVRGSGTSGTKTGLVNSPKTLPRDAGISGGAQTPLTNSQPVGTSVDGISGGVTSGSRPGGGAAGIGPGGSVGPVGGGAANGSGAAGLPGAAGGFGATTAGAAGAAGRGAGAMGRGMPGATGAGGGKAGAGGKSGSTRGGSLARTRGGVVGEAEEGAAGKRGAQGGSGLHQSRGAAGKGQTGSKGRNGMMAGRGANSGHEEEERSTGQRPDYLVEDEETWIPDRDVAPRVVE